MFVCVCVSVCTAVLYFALLGLIWRCANENSVRRMDSQNAPATELHQYFKMASLYTVLSCVFHLLLRSKMFAVLPVILFFVRAIIFVWRFIGYILESVAMKNEYVHRHMYNVHKKTPSSQLFGDLGRCTTVYLLFSACHVISNMCSFITKTGRKEGTFLYRFCHTFSSHMQIDHSFRYRCCRLRRLRVNPSKKDINGKWRHLIHSFYYVRATWVTHF